MLPKLNHVCHEILSYSETTRESVLCQINNDAELPETVRTIISFLIINAPALLSPSSPSDRQGCGPAHSPAIQGAHQ